MNPHNKYMYAVAILLVGLFLAITQFQWALPWSPHWSLDCLLSTFCGIKQQRVLCADMVKVVHQRRHLDIA